MKLNFRRLKEIHNPIKNARDILRYIGPGLIVTVGFIDPGNWASNLAAGSSYGFTLLWMVTLSTLMLIFLQHNVAHLGIATGDCLSEAASRHLKPWLSRSVLSTAILAGISTAVAEIMGGAIALNVLFGLPIRVGAVIVLLVVLVLLFSNSYRSIEKIIIAFVSIIGLSFVYELSIVKIDWGAALHGWVSVNFPPDSMPLIMAVLGAVVMPHNIFLHSEIIQSREWNKEDETIIKRQLKFEFTDTLLSMIVGWAINSAMIILAASVFFATKTEVTDLIQASELLKPTVGNAAAVVFGVALLFAGVSSTATAGIAGGSIFAGIFKEPYNISDIHSRIGVCAILGTATTIIFFISDPLKALIFSQMILSIQLPITVFLQIYLTSSEKVMGKFKNSRMDNILLVGIAITLTVLNILLFRFMLL